MSFGALIEKFRAVALDRIERMNVLLVQLEHDPQNSGAVEELLREIHTLKGEAKMMGFADVNLVAHQTEHLLVLASTQGFRAHADAVDIAFEGFDIVRHLLTKSAGAADAPVDLAGFVDRVNRARVGDAAADPGAESRETPQILHPAASPDAGQMAARQEDAGRPGAGPTDVGQSGAQEFDAQEFDALAASLAQDSWVQEPADSLSEASLSEVFEEEAARRAEWGRAQGHRSTRTRIDAARAQGAAGDSEAQPAAGTTPQATDRLLRLQVGASLRVDLEKLERLGDVAGEVMLLGRRLNYNLGELTQIRDVLRAWLEDVDGQLPLKTVGGLRNLVHRVDDFASSAREATYLMSARSAQLDEEVRGLRHVPLAQVMSHYPRAVRDLAHEQGKRVRLVHAFGNVEVDRVLLTALSEPMLHLIRNAVDHGVESPAERAAQGKEREAVIWLAAEYVGDGIRVIIRDDGRGIDPDVLRQKAMERGLLSADRATNMRDQEALALIFEPGFTTRDQVSDLSGRGIGMDVVRRQITEVGGYIEVESQPGQGTAISLMLPVSSAVSQVLMVEIAGRTFALAAKQVTRVAAVSPFELVESHGGVFVRLDGEMLALRDWSRALGAQGARAPVGPGQAMTLLVLRQGQGRAAVWVDRVLGEREAMSRPLGEFLRGVRMCQGVALTDSGEVVPLLNIAELLGRAENPSFKAREAARTVPGTVWSAHNAAGAPPASAALQPARPAPTAAISGTLAPRKPAAGTILVVEDSEITRDLVCGMLRAHGFHFLVAEDGLIGWEMLQRHPIALVLTDVQMPRMSGLELLGHIRASQRFAELPVVMLTTLGDPKDKARALELGADGYLVKLDFQERDLIDTVRRHLSAS